MSRLPKGYAYGLRHIGNERTDQAVPNIPNQPHYMEKLSGGLKIDTERPQWRTGIGGSIGGNIGGGDRGSCL